MTRITRNKFIICAGLLALLCALLSPGVRADGTGLGDVTITLPSISGNAGDTITVLGNLTNNSANTLDFGGDFVTPNSTAISGFGDVFFNGLLGFGPSSIGGNSTLTDVDLFTIFIAAGAAPGSYDLNFYDLLGGIDPACNLDPTQCGVQLGSVQFTVNVQGAVPTPEPGTLLLLATGLLAGLIVIRRAAL
ncbi:MAG TPA: PEP-CTERM sorting domain-containing protein [Candidatus Acidoferrum sp.]|nr:PEP-CTERM sorting domain-containing protein [Candidatus Acidoferrum sp.]